MIDIAVLGAGVMGTNHARVASTTRELRVVQVIDADLERAHRLAASVGADAAASVDALIPGVTAAVLALPNHLHAEVGVPLLERGIHLLVEKPIASTIDEADALIAASEVSGAVLMVGHIERFNAAVRELPHLLDGLHHIRAARISPYSSRIADGVVLDLMIHDLDVIRWLVGSTVESVHALTRHDRSPTEDLATVLLRFANGVTADLTASRLGQQKIREISLTQRDTYVTADLIRQDITLHRVQHSEFLEEHGVRYRQSGVIEIPFLERRGEPLQAELLEFARAINEAGTPLVSGRDGREALHLVMRVLEAAG